MFLFLGCDLSSQRTKFKAEYEILVAEMSASQANKHLHTSKWIKLYTLKKNEKLVNLKLFSLMEAYTVTKKLNNTIINQSINQSTLNLSARASYTYIVSHIKKSTSIIFTIT